VISALKNSSAACHVHSHAGGSGVGQQLLDDHLRLGELALADVVAADAPTGVDEVERGPAVLAEGQP
jgi:hypothetical protein